MFVGLYVPIIDRILILIVPGTKQRQLRSVRHNSKPTASTPPPPPPPSSPALESKRTASNGEDATSAAEVAAAAAAAEATRSPSTEDPQDDECVLCCYPLPLDLDGSVYHECCGELICCGCIIAQKHTLIIGENVKQPIAGSKGEV